MRSCSTLIFGVFFLGCAVFATRFDGGADATSARAADDPAARPARTFEEYAPWREETGLELTDYHIHLRGGMTAEKAIERARRTGVKSGVLENVGEDWPLSSNAKIAEFIDGVDAANASLPPNERLRVGIQVNDRDWFTKLDRKLYRRLDFVLADTMIMGVDAAGKPQKLWLLPKNSRVDQKNWFERYFHHCMTVVEEPIDILANPTYLPDFIADRYDELWTEARMKRLIQAAIDNDVALEIQAESEFPKPKFVALALEMGAKLTFGSNNFDDGLKDLAAWKRNIDAFNLRDASLWRDVLTRKTAFAPARDANGTADETADETADGAGNGTADADVE